jgi:GAF domain-containing protein
MLVPVVHDGRVRSTLEVASQRPRRATDWDIALVRILADRLAAVVAHHPELAEPAL